MLFWRQFLETFFEQEVTGFEGEVGGIGAGCGYWGEGAAVEGAGAVFGERPAMDGSSVALVLGEAVVGVLEVEIAEEVVAVDLGDDRGGGDGEGEGIAIEELGLGER